MGVAKNRSFPAEMSEYGDVSFWKKMAAAGYSNIMCLDYAIDFKEEVEDGCTWVNGDVRDMLAPSGKVAEGSVKYAFDKACLDAILCGSNSPANSYKYVCQVAKALQPGGKWIVVSFGKPEERKEYLETFASSVGLKLSASQTAPIPKCKGVTPPPELQPLNVYIL